MNSKEKKQIKEMYEVFSRRVVSTQVEIMQIIATLQGKISEFDRIHGEFLKNFNAFIPPEKIEKPDQDIDVRK